MVLGLWDGHDAGAALVAGGRLVFALSEERPTRRKRLSGFPQLSLDACLSWARERDLRPTHAALAGCWGRGPQRLGGPLYTRSDPHREPLGLASRLAMGWENRAATTPVLRRIEGRAGRAAVAARLHRAGGPSSPLIPIDHHEAHAFSALFGDRRDDGLVITCDAYGDGLSATVRRPARPLEPTVRLPAPGGLPLLYGAVTVALGFREGDEGKVTGRAARGDPDRLRVRFRELFAPDPAALELRSPPLRRRGIAGLVAGARREDVCAALQAETEERFARWAADRLRADPGARSLLLAGGLFANVSLNRVLGGLPGLEGLFVFPHMGDGGLAAGAAHALWYRLTGALAEPLSRADLGPVPDLDHGTGAARRAGLAVRRLDAPATAVADHLRAGRVICRYRGRDEVGPRALGNRSILFAAGDPALGQRVNRALGRDTFMPFGPLIAAEDAGTALSPACPGIDLAHMTTAVTAEPRFRDECPGAVHLDGTARAQVVGRDADPELHALVCAHRDAGGGPALINTSFNLHGEPIVHTPSDAVRTFVASGLDVLLLGDRECRRP